MRRIIILLNLSTTLTLGYLLLRSDEYKKGIMIAVILNLIAIALNIVVEVQDGRKKTKTADNSK
nr:MAG TPA: hypothetical protein [Caudoviricetes sp.]